MHWRAAAGQVLCVFAGLVATGAGAADWSVGSERWEYEVHGFVNERGQRLDFQNDLHLEDERDSRLALALGGFRGAWPDWALSQVALRAHGHRETEESTLLGIIVLRPGTRITTDAAFDDTDLTAHWPLRRGTWALSPGLTLKHLKGHVLIMEDGNGLQSRQRYDEWFPQLHLGLGWQPFTRLRLESVAQGISYQDSSAREWRALLEWRLLGGFHLRGGWQEKRYDIRLTDYRLDAKLEGPLLGALLRF